MTYVAEQTSQLVYIETAFLTPAKYTSVSELPEKLKEKYQQYLKSIPLVGIVTPLIVIQSDKINPSTYSYDYQIFFDQQDVIYLAAKELRQPCPAISFSGSLPADQLVMIKDQLGL